MSESMVTLLVAMMAAPRFVQLVEARFVVYCTW